MTAVPPDLAALLVEHANAYDDHRRAVVDWIAHDGLGGYAVAKRERNASTRHHKVMWGLVAWTRANAASLTPEARAADRARTLELIGDVQDKAEDCTPGPAESAEECEAAAVACDAARAALLAHLGLTDEPGGGR